MLNASNLLLVVQLLSTIHPVLAWLKPASRMPKSSNKWFTSPGRALEQEVGRPPWS